MWDDGAFWRGALEGKLRLRACRDCGRLCHPPLPVCPHCQGLDWEDRDAEGTARLHAWCRIPASDDTGEGAYTIVVADLAEGVRVVSNLIDAPDPKELAEGTALKLCFEDRDGMRLPAFRLASGVETGAAG